MNWRSNFYLVIIAILLIISFIEAQVSLEQYSSKILVSLDISSRSKFENDIILFNINNSTESLSCPKVLTQDLNGNPVAFLSCIPHEDVLQTQFQTITYDPSIIDNFTELVLELTVDQDRLFGLDLVVSLLTYDAHYSHSLTILPSSHFTPSRNKDHHSVPALNSPDSHSKSTSLDFSNYLSDTSSSIPVPPTLISISNISISKVNNSLVHYHTLRNHTSSSELVDKVITEVDSRYTTTNTIAFPDIYLENLTVDIAGPLHIAFPEKNLNYKDSSAECEVNNSTVTSSINHQTNTISLLSLTLPAGSNVFIECNHLHLTSQSNQENYKLTLFATAGSETYSTETTLKIKFKSKELNYFIVTIVVTTMVFVLIFATIARCQCLNRPLKTLRQRWIKYQETKKLNSKKNINTQNIGNEVDGLEMGHGYGALYD